jgi:hypothetical protein
VDEQDELQHQRDQRIRKPLADVVANEDAEDRAYQETRAYWIARGRAEDHGLSTEEAHELGVRAVAELRAQQDLPPGAGKNESADPGLT